MRLLIVDDRPAVRKAIRMRLAAEDDLLVIGEASDGEAALEQAVSLCPDVVLMDVEMPYMDGIAATCALRKLCPQTSVVMLSIHDDPLTQARARDAGAAAFVAKSMPPDALLAAIRVGSGVPDTRIARDPRPGCDSLWAAEGCLTAGGLSRPRRTAPARRNQQ